MPDHEETIVSVATDTEATSATISARIVRRLPAPAELPRPASRSAGVRFARTEGIVPAPEPTHAIAQTVREALACKETGEEKVILTALCGHGHFDMAAYDAYLSGRLVDEDVSAERLSAGLAGVPVLTGTLPHPGANLRRRPRAE